MDSPVVISCLNSDGGATSGTSRDSLKIRDFGAGNSSVEYSSAERRQLVMFATDGQDQWVGQ